MTGPEKMEAVKKVHAFAVSLGLTKAETYFYCRDREESVMCTVEEIPSEAYMRVGGKPRDFDVCMSMCAVTVKAVKGEVDPEDPEDFDTVGEVCL